MRLRIEYAVGFDNLAAARDWTFPQNKPIARIAQLRISLVSARRSQALRFLGRHRCIHLMER
jgi:hypothetical protein